MPGVHICMGYMYLYCAINQDLSSEIELSINLAMTVVSNYDKDQTNKLESDVLRIPSLYRLLQRRVSYHRVGRLNRDGPDMP